MERLFDNARLQPKKHLGTAFAYSLIHDLLLRHIPARAANCKITIREATTTYTVTITTFHTMSAIHLRTHISLLESELCDILTEKKLISPDTILAIIIRQ